MKSFPYYLSNHAFICLADDHYVFLDLRNDEYLCLGHAQTDAIKVLLNGHQLLDGHVANIRLHDTHDSDSSAAVQALLQKDLLVRDVTDGKVLEPPRVDTAVGSMMRDSDNSQPEIGLTHVWNCFVALAIASKDLRWGSIERTVRKVEARKSAHATDAISVDSGAIADLFKIFQTLRPYYPRPYLCLFDSLALVHFLARYAVFPQWVYGVQLQPFAAHCWVQTGDQVVNDIIDNVRDYTPIMSI